MASSLGRRGLAALAVTVIGTMITTAEAQAADWFTTSASMCAGDVNLANGLATIVPGQLSLLPIAPAGNYAVKLAPAAISSAISERPHVAASVALNDSNVNTVRSLIHSAAEDAVPVGFSITIAALLNIVVPENLLNVAAGWLLGEVTNKLNAPSVRLGIVEGYVAKGGTLAQQQFVLTNNTGRFMMSSLTYTVAVGQEYRTAVLYTCIYPIDTIVSQFQTTGPYNNKVLKPSGPGHWGIWDIEDGKWDDDTLVYDHQDATSYYLLQREIENDKVVGQAVHKISIMGGSWQRKHYDSQTYGTLYANVVAR